MSEIRKFIRKIPGSVYFYRKMQALKFLTMSPERLFTHYYHKNGWSGENSLSGPGSDPAYTKVLAVQLPGFLKSFNIQSILDVPCGDFLWMEEIDLSSFTYTGGDIVGDLVRENNTAYGKNNISFLKLDILTDELPQTDVIFCRDCLVHFSYTNIQKSLRNIIKSNSTYLLTTTFNQRAKNKNIITGEWRPLNLEKAPFLLPPPLAYLDEGCTIGNDQYKDKMMGLWKISDLKEAIGNDMPTAI